MIRWRSVSEKRGKYKAVETEARKRKGSGNCVVMRDKDVFEIVKKYYKG